MEEPTAESVCRIRGLQNPWTAESVIGPTAGTAARAVDSVAGREPKVRFTSSGDAASNPGWTHCRPIHLVDDHTGLVFSRSGFVMIAIGFEETLAGRSVVDLIGNLPICRDTTLLSDPYSGNEGCVSTGLSTAVTS